MAMRAPRRRPPRPQMTWTWKIAHPSRQRLRLSPSPILSPSPSQRSLTWSWRAPRMTRRPPRIPWQVTPHLSLGWEGSRETHCCISANKGGAAPGSGISDAAMFKKQRRAGSHAVVPAGQACNRIRTPCGASANPACGCMMYYLRGPAGAQPGAPGVPGGSNAPPGLAPIRTQPLYGGETASAPAAEAAPAPPSDAPAALDGASTGAGAQVRPRQ